MAHNEMSRQDLQCLPFFNIIQFILNFFLNFADVILVLYELMKDIQYCCFLFVHIKKILTSESMYYMYLCFLP